MGEPLILKAARAASSTGHQSAQLQAGKEQSAISSAPTPLNPHRGAVLPHQEPAAISAPQIQRAGPNQIGATPPGDFPQVTEILGFGRIAQLVEQLTLNQRVQGSSPCAPTNLFKGLRPR